MEICDGSKCTGCCACMNICPSNAISMLENDVGEIVPVKNELCTECEKCTRVCSVISKTTFAFPLKCYALWACNTFDRETCASGGVATTFGREIIKSGGSVYGTSYDSNCNLKYMKATTEEELEAFKGSKYVQAYAGYIYQSVKEELQAGKRVLFVGTPCQADGLRHYLRTGYAGLILVDLICHGTPPAKYLREYINAKVGSRKIDKVTFRGKNDYFITFYNGTEIVYKEISNFDLYFSSFSEGLIQRRSCYTCRYAIQERCSDITIGDFWGINRDTLKTPYSGRISVALLNTESGCQFFESIKNQFIYEERDLSEAINGNNQLRKPSVLHKERQKFELYYKQNGFLHALLKTSMKGKIIKTKFSSLIKKIIK